MMFEQNICAVHEDNESNCQLTCFICVQPVAVIDNDGSDCVWHSLCGIVNHLKLKSAKSSVEEDNTLTLTDVVPLCEKCSKVVRKLSGLCMDLEEVKLKIKYHLNELDQLIVLEEMDQSNESFNKRDDSAQLKRELKEKCGNIMQGPSLRVVVSKLEMDMDTEQMDMEDDLSSSHQIFKWDIDSGYDNEYQLVKEEPGTSINDQFEYEGSDSEEELEPELQSEYQLIIAENLTTPKPSSSKTSGNCSEGKTKPNAKPYSCSECAISYVTKHKLDEHLMIFHPERFFPFPNDTSATTPATANHKMCLIHLLNTEVDYCEDPKFDGYKCIYCGILFQNVNKRMSILTHLIKTHQDILKRELIQLKKEKSGEELKAIVKMPVFNYGPKPKPSSGISERRVEINCKLKHFRNDIQKMKREYTCVNCGVRTTTPRVHQAIHHPERVLVKWKSEEMDMSVFKQYCVHLIEELKEKFWEKETGGENKRVKVKCPLCPKLYAHNEACRKHVVLGHIDILGEELKKLQENVQPDELKKIIRRGLEVAVEECQVCGVVLTKAGIIGHMKRAHLEEYLKNYAHFDCVNCGTAFSSRTGLSEHECVRVKVKGEKKESRVSSKFICGVCKRRFGSSSGLSYHYSLSHVGELFDGVKGEKVGEGEWRKWCEEVMEGEMRDLEQVCGEDYKVKFKCGDCGEKFRTRQKVWVHLVGKHKERVEGKVRRRMEEEKGGEEGNGGSKKESVTLLDEGDLGGEGEVNGILGEGDDGGEGMEVDVKEEGYLEGDSMYSY